MNESVQKWLDELVAAPSAAIQKLVLGYAGVSAWSRSSLRESLVESFQTHAEVLDAAIAGWLRERLMKLPPEKTPTLVWASHLQDLFSALADLPLPQVAMLLRGRLRDFRSWLRPLRTDESLDPEAAYLAALAWAETNQHLEGLWQGLALRRNREPAYYTDIGLLGLRKTRDEQTRMPPEKAPFLLLATLIDLADLPGLSEKDWLLTTRALLGGYHYSLETWVREFEPVLEARTQAQHGPEWLKKVLPHPRAMQQRQEHSPHGIPPTVPLQEVDAVITEVASHSPDALGERLAVFLERERAYANTTRNPHFLVRTFNRLAEAARTHDPDWATARAEEALAWDEDNARNWTVLARCLWSRGLRAQRTGDEAAAETDCREAIDTLWKARFRFRWNAYVRTELGRLHRDAGDWASAETIYRETMTEFPDNAAALTGLSYILFHQSATTRNHGLREEARALLQKAAALGDRSSTGFLNGFDQRWERFASQQQTRAELEHEGDESIALPLPKPSEMRPAQRLGRALMLQWQARRAESAGERERLFVEAKALLELPDELTGECRTAFVEARGFLLLARDLASEARAYFEQQLAAAAPRCPLGFRLGFSEARSRLGETLSGIEGAELASFGPEGSILPLVLKVVRLLESAASDDELRSLLLELYPRVRDLAGMPASELGEEGEPAEPAAPARQRETPDTMMAHLLMASVFRPAAINTLDDLRAAGSIGRVRVSLKSHRDDVFSVAEKFALAA
jgi:tetratricopeptide (TPR) repeat protein